MVLTTGRWRLRLLAFVAAAANLLAPASGGLAGTQATPAAKAILQQSIVLQGRTFDVVSVDLQKADIRLFWRNEKGARLKNFANLDHWLKAKGERLIAAMNAGIYETDYTPLGLHVENGVVMRKLNTRAGKGNFYLKPNGVFFIGDDGARIVETAKYAKLGAKPRWATQSGPLLLEKGAIHRAFKQGSTDECVRSGVGVSSPTMAHLVISKDEVNLYDFAAFFRDALHCTDALYLDGAICSMYAPELGRQPRDYDDFVGILGVFERR